MESDKTMLWSMMGLISLQSKTLPDYLRQLYKLWKSYRENLSAFSHIDIPELEEASMGSRNEIYSSVGAYLSSLEATAKASKVSISRPRRNANLAFNLPSHHTVKDEFQGAQIWWTHHVEIDEKQGNRDRDRDRGSGSTERKYVLKISNIDRARVLSSYIDHISNFAYELKRRSKDRKLFSNSDPRGRWNSVAFKHSSTFKTLALDPALKDRVTKDLDCFQQSRDFYRRTGRAWKRGYLLYGPPGTGKSSLIAAIANYMHYDVYDLELSNVLDNSTLRELLLGTASKSVIVIEDIDCAANLPEKAMCRRPPDSQDEKKGSREIGRGMTSVTLSGLLNFADGLWSSCGEERIMIFTTNHKDKLDPALLRSGRMDMHILLSYCGFPAFKQLVYNYLDIEDHKLFDTVEEKIQCGGCLTPAEICEILIQNQSDPNTAMKSVITALEGSIARPASSPEKDEKVLSSQE
ncbi:hypothetical protein KI387_015919 [Taxus chinensis]|uniref:AAA+ ATPase domain-containing protein n=1 Tax=Taxus chinensis TaxID=29808 RepID=A0AA38GG22_TAXCH|nr:hypothetical protein KI387_015919 [Taxus chinensis]